MSDTPDPTLEPTNFPTDLEDNPDDQDVITPPKIDLPPPFEEAPKPAPLVVDNNEAPKAPTEAPTKTQEPTYLTSEPTKTQEPTLMPTYLTEDPTTRPTMPKVPTNPPTVAKPTNPPSTATSTTGTVSETNTDEPTIQTTSRPTARPTNQPTVEPTMRPTNRIDRGGGLKGAMYRNKRVGFQSNWGPAHPGSMVYDFTRNSIYVTGTTFAKNRYGDSSTEFAHSTCFVGEMPIADLMEWKTVDDPIPPYVKDPKEPFVIPDDMLDQEVMGCQAIYYDDESKSDDILYVAGSDSQDGVLRKGIIDGFINFYERSRNKPDWSLIPFSKDVHNPTTDQSDKVPVRIPVAMTGGRVEGKDSIHMVMVNSLDDLLTEEYIENRDAKNPQNYKNSLLPPGLEVGDPSPYAVPKRGSNFFMSLHHYTVTDDKKLQMQSGEDFPLDGQVFPTGLINLQPSDKELVLIGHLEGKPPQRWGMETAKRGDGTTDRLNDKDGFATIFPRKPGENNLRFASVEYSPPLDDHIYGACTGELDEKLRAESFYVTGSTYGTMPNVNTTNILSDFNDESIDGNSIDRLSAWISKIDTKTRKVLWTTQLYAANDDFSLDGGKTEAFGCHVIDDDPLRMYVGGTVYGGGIMDSNQKSYGDDDVWVAQLWTDDGSLNWIRQIGSSGKDKIARTNGVESDLNGHAIIFGETNGELYRKRSKSEPPMADDGSTTDVFITTLDKHHGRFESTIEMDRAASKRSGIIAGIVLGVLVALFVTCCLWCRARRRKYRVPNRADGLVTTDRNMPFTDEDGEENDGVTKPASQTNLSSGISPPDAAFQDNLPAAQTKMV